MKGSTGPQPLRILKPIFYSLSLGA
jgi:hypothetical protein